MSEGTFSPSTRGTIRAAMFVDFDNVYSGLRALDAQTAERFAVDPGQWIAAVADAEGVAASLRFLVRNCYLNPDVYSKYRPFWTRAGFRVIDCPSLTQQGKSSTDINLVLDAVDVLAGETRIDEFFIASADADFTSLVQRFRAADRRTTVIVAGAAAAAYREMADAVVQSDELFSMLSGSAAASVNENRFPAEVKEIPAARQARSGAEAVLELIKSASGPIRSAIVAHRALATEPSLGDDWDGQGKFGAWITQIDQGIEYSPVPVPGWVWDSNRFSQNDLPSVEKPSLPEIAQQVARVTGVPAISTVQYRQLFVSMAAAKATETTNRNELAKNVRDACAAAYTPVGRAAVNFVIQSLIYAKFPFNGLATAQKLASTWTLNVESMCRIAGMQFTPPETAAFKSWVSGGFLSTHPSTSTNT